MVAFAPEALSFAVLVLEFAVLVENDLKAVGRCRLVLEDVIPAHHHVAVRCGALLLPGDAAAADFGGIEVGPIGHHRAHRRGGRTAAVARGGTCWQGGVGEGAQEAGVGTELKHAVGQHAHAAVVGAGIAKREAAGEGDRGLVIVTRVVGAGAVPRHRVGGRLPSVGVAAKGVGRSHGRCHQRTAEKQGQDQAKQMIHRTTVDVSWRST